MGGSEWITGIEDQGRGASIWVAATPKILSQNFLWGEAMEGGFWGMN